MPRLDDQQHLVGVDLGGTKILAGVFDHDLSPLACAKASTRPDGGEPAVVKRIARCIDEALNEANVSIDDVRGIGVGAPGNVDPNTGNVVDAVNLGWKSVPLRHELEAKLGVPVFLENDANLALLGIFEQELRREPRNVVGIFIGTGIGGAFIVDRKLYTGSHHGAGEIGHMVIDLKGPECGCGRRGCFEALASRTALFRDIRRAVKLGQETVLTDMLGKNLDDLRSGHLRKAIRRGDKFIRELVQHAAEYSAVAVANLITLHDPDVVVLGGGVIEALEAEMMPIIIEQTKKFIPEPLMRGIEVMSSRLADNAGILGGAVLVRDRAEAE